MAAAVKSLPRVGGPQEVWVAVAAEVAAAAVCGGMGGVGGGEDRLFLVSSGISRVHAGLVWTCSAPLRYLCELGREVQGDA